MKYDDLPKRWKDRLAHHLVEIRPDGWQHLNSTDFSENYRIDFPDGSAVELLNAFSLEMDSEIAVFTEHCGYHLFSSHDLELKPFTRVVWM